MKKLVFTGIATFFVLLLSVDLASADQSILGEPIPVPPGGEPVVRFEPRTPIDLRVENVKAEGQWVAAKEMPFEHVYRVASDTRFSDPDNVQLRFPVVKPIAKGDVVLMSFWARRPKAGGQPNNLNCIVGGDAKTPAYTYKLSAYRDWKQHVRGFVADSAIEPNQTIRFQLGEAGTIVELADVQLLNYGPDHDIDTLPFSTVMYEGREPDAPWRAEARKRIEKIRMADLSVRVLDSQGRPVPDAQVHVAMQKHAFGFGNAVDSDILGREQDEFPRSYRGRATVTWDDAQQYRQIIKTYFDRVTFAAELRPHNWIAMSENPSNRKYRTLMDRTRPWLLEHGIAARGHYLAWAPMNFNRVEQDFVGNPKAHRDWLFGNMADVIPATQDFVNEWDTINHIIGWGKHTYEKEYGSPQIYADILAEARRLAPDAIHTINEGKVLPDGYKREPYLKMIRFLNEQGQAPDSVGFMGHFGLTTLTPPEELLEVYDDFAQVAPRLQLTELDVDAGDDEQLQADYLRDVMIASFSHPSFHAIIQWGFWEPTHWKPAAALWRTDWSLKPAGEVFVDLVKNQWWTDEKLKTNNAGQASLRAFHGSYTLTVQAQGITKTIKTELTPDGAQVEIKLPPR